MNIVKRKGTKGICRQSDNSIYRPTSGGGGQLLDKLKERNIHVRFVSACCTDQIQPLDLGINASLKQIMKSKFEDFYPSAVSDQLKSNVPVDKGEIDVFEEIRMKTDLIRKAWLMAGIDFSQ
ncbi:hypothetical protein KUTeg_021772 [Tegillarca granosa]|uniref:Uncharacterized protein n=1 Tax=Tegillarca granosa TaxID=220873 RepID=A0ABQ9EAG6_TEGGR|nr:hypothetical protein KUTeg_021772 [Tegillarca granosa]